MNTTRRFEYVSDKYGQGGGREDWYESVEEFEQLIAECGMPNKLRMCGAVGKTQIGYRDEDGDLILVEHTTP